MSSNPTWVAVQQCQMCGKVRRKCFTCRNCLNEGNFWKVDKDGDNRERYACKQKRLRIVNAVNKEYEKRLADIVAPDEKYYAKEKELVRLRNRIEVLTLVIKGAKERNANAQRNNAENVNKLSERRKTFDELKTRKVELENNKFDLYRKKVSKEQVEERLRRKRSSLKHIQVSHVYALVKYIFPIEERKSYTEFGTPPRATPTSSEEHTDVISEVNSAAEMELEAATRTVHVDGRWVTSQDAAHEMERSIVGVGMPPANDFMKYFEWLKSYRMEPRKHESHSGLHSNSVLNIPASLVYTSQLTDGLSFLLGVCLPNRVEYYDFSIFKVSRKRLLETVNILSQNVMQLCSSQLVPSEELDSNLMLRNLSLLVSSTDLGWWGAYDTKDSNRSHRLLERSFDSDSSVEEITHDSDCDDGDDDPITVEPEEWDKLLDIPPDHSEVQMFAPTMSSLAVARERSLSSSASDLVSSAAASVISLWSWNKR